MYFKLIKHNKLNVYESNLFRLKYFSLYKVEIQSLNLGWGSDLDLLVNYTSREKVSYAG